MLHLPKIELINLLKCLSAGPRADASRDLERAECEPSSACSSEPKSSWPAEAPKWLPEKGNWLGAEADWLASGPSSENGK